MQWSFQKTVTDQKIKTEVKRQQNEERKQIRRKRFKHKIRNFSVKFYIRRLITLTNDSHILVISSWFFSSYRVRRCQQNRKGAVSMISKQLFHTFWIHITEGTGDTRKWAFMRSLKKRFRATPDTQSNINIINVTTI